MPRVQPLPQLHRSYSTLLLPMPKPDTLEEIEKDDNVWTQYVDTALVFDTSGKPHSVWPRWQCMARMICMAWIESVLPRQSHSLLNLPHCHSSHNFYIFDYC